MNKIKVTYQHGGRYTTAWIGHAETKNGSSFSLSYLYNGGKFTSKKAIEKYIYGELSKKYEVESVTLKEII